MSDRRLDALAETARNRGLKLVRSRARTPGKKGYGKAGLVQPSGTPVFGMEPKGPNAEPEAIEDYLRTLESNDWDASLGTAEPQRGRVKEKAGRAASGSPPQSQLALLEPQARKAQPPAPPKPEIRQALTKDAARLAELICELGHKIELTEVRRNLVALKKAGESPLVVTLGGQIVGMCGIGYRIAIARPAPIGRITSLVVTKDAQGQGLGRMLVEAAEAWMRKRGCEIVEVTSNDRRGEAHAFYRHMGFERTGIRFAKVR